MRFKKPTFIFQDVSIDPSLQALRDLEIHPDRKPTMAPEASQHMMIHCATEVDLFSSISTGGYL